MAGPLRSFIAALNVLYEHWLLLDSELDYEE